MPLENGDPLDPEEWLNRAKSNLLQANHHEPGIYFEDLLFLAQQAVEKALKALLLLKEIKVPHTHNLARLITEVKKHFKRLPKNFEQVAWLTDFSVSGRYPSAGEPVEEKEYRRGLKDATFVVEYVESEISQLKSVTQD